MGIEEKLEVTQRALHDLAAELRQRAADKQLRVAPTPDHGMRWVKLERYLELSGDTYDAVKSRRKAGKWLDGRECKSVDGRIWIDLRAVESWIDAW